jgi:hypothetical protein
MILQLQGRTQRLIRYMEYKVPGESDLVTDAEKYTPLFVHTTNKQQVRLSHSNRFGGSINTCARTWHK